MNSIIPAILLIMYVLFPLQISLAQNGEPIPADSTLEILIQIDALITAELVGTLAGLSLTAAAFLVATKGNFDSQITILHGTLKVSSAETRKQLQHDIDSLEKSEEKVSKAVRGLVKAFFIFIGNLVGIIAFFDSTFHEKFMANAEAEAVSLLGEGLPFAVALAFLVSGAYWIREVYVNKNN